MYIFIIYYFNKDLLSIILFLISRYVSLEREYILKTVPCGLETLFKKDLLYVLQAAINIYGTTQIFLRRGIG